MCWLLILFVEALDHDVYISLQFALTQVQSARQRLTPMRGNLILSCFHFNIDKQDFRLEYRWQFEICRTWELHFIILSSIGIHLPFQRQTFFVVFLGSKMFKSGFREICYDTNKLLILCCWKKNLHFGANVLRRTVKWSFFLVLKSYLKMAEIEIVNTLLGWMPCFNWRISYLELKFKLSCPV